MKTKRILKMKKNQKNWNHLVQTKKSRLAINYKKLLLHLRINFIRLMSINLCLVIHQELQKHNT